MATERDVRTHVSHEDGIALFKRIRAAADGSGYCLAMYGSTLTEQTGKDLDLVAVPWRMDTRRDLLVQALRSVGRFEIVGETAWFTGAKVETADGMSIDIHIHRNVAGTLSAVVH